MKGLKDINKEPFIVPEGYFEQLNKDIMKATANNCTTVVRRKNHILGKLSHIAGYAAAAAILIILASNLFVPGNKASCNIAETDIYNSENEYIDNILNSYTIDDYTFYCYLTETDFE